MERTSWAVEMHPPLPPSNARKASATCKWSTEIEERQGQRRSCEGEVTSSKLLPSVYQSRPVRGRRPSERERDYLKPASLAAVDVKQDVQGKRLINASNANLLMVQGSTHSSFIYIIVHACSLHCRTSDRCAPLIHSMKMKS